MRKYIIFSIILVFCISISLCQVNIYADNNDKDNKKDEYKEIIISAAGDCTLGVDSRYNNNFNNYYNSNNSKYFLKKVKKVFEKDDITIVNLEGTLTSSTDRADKTFTFKGPTKYSDILTKGSVEVVNLANNHTFDFGQKGFDETKSTLKKADISYCYGTTIAYKKVKKVKIAFLGFNELSGIKKETIKDTIKKAKDKGAVIIITSFHWGIEGDHYPEQTQKDFAHYAIDQGAALVIGHHPHVLQGIELYKDRYILYSLGNFCFGGNSNPADKDTMIFQQTFYVKDGKLSTKNNAKIIPCSLSGVSDKNNFQPKILKDSEKARVIKKIRTYSKGMKVKLESNGKIMALKNTSKKKKKNK